MTVWNKVSKINQKRHRERHQPNKRSNLGLLEKHKDYKKRATDYHKKEKVLKKLKEKALNKNPNEYYHHMVNLELHGEGHKKKSNVEHTLEQRLLLEHKNISYIGMKLNVEHHKVEKLKSSAHLINFSPSSSKCNIPQNNEIATKLHEIDEKSLKKCIRLKEKKYKELLKRIKRKKQLAIIKEKMEVEKHLKNCKRISRPKLISQGTKTKAAVYEWKYERKK